MNNAKQAAEPLRVRIAMIYPLSVTLGGFEHQAIQTCRALQSSGVDAQLLDWNKADDEYDILHIFGVAAHWHEVSLMAARKCRIVFSALGAPSQWKQPVFKWSGRAATLVGRMLRQPTIYGQACDTLRRAGCTICANAFQHKFYQRAYDLPPAKMAVIPHGVPAARYTGDAALFEKRHGARDYVLFAGNIVARKRPLQLARVLKRLGLPGVFIGGTLNSESERAYALEFEAALKGAPNLLWVRGLAYDDPLLDSAYAGARVLCLPSAAESQPLAALEAMAAGVPVILADRPYARQAPFAHAARCRLDDDQSLGQALDITLAMPERYRRALPESYAWPAVAREILGVYRRVMGQ